MANVQRYDDTSTDEYINGIGEQTVQGLAGTTAGMGAAALYNRNRPFLRKAIDKALFIPAVNIALAASDGYDGYTDANAIYDTAQPTPQQRAAATIGGLAHGASLGFIPTKEVALGYVPKQPNAADLQPRQLNDIEIKQAESMNKIMSGLSKLNTNIVR